jgi:hypothetical protein
MIIPFLFSSTSCIKQAPKQEELCKCVENKAFQEQMILSEECLNACVDYFGEDLSGMEKWFQDNCRMPQIETGEENSPPVTNI